jgi:hypothetical protein
MQGDDQDQISDDGDDYKVGPGKPPRDHQWRKGQSGNPGGRPRGASVTAELRRLMAQEHGGKTIAVLVAERMVKDALSGKPGSVRELLERVDGKVTEKDQVEGAGGITALIIPPPRVTGEPQADEEARMERDRLLREAAAQAPPGTKLVIGDWPLRV